MEPSQEIFEVVRAGNTGRLQTLLTANPGLANVRNERGHTPVLIAQYRDKHEAVALLLASEPELDIFDAASVGRTQRVAEWLERDPGHQDTVKMLLACGADPKEAVSLAATKGRHDILTLLKGQA